MYIKDNLDLYDEYEAEQARWLAKCPKCAKCGETITDRAFDIDGLYCEDCMQEWLADIEKDVAELIDEEENQW